MLIYVAVQSDENGYYLNIDEPRASTVEWRPIAT